MIRQKHYYGLNHLYFLTRSTSKMLHSDVTGSTTMVTDQAGTVDWDMNFYPWGKAWRQAGSTYWHVFGDMGFEDINDVSPTPNRDYAEALGRWLTPDPLAGEVTNPQSLNRYAYALNNPASNNDPSGLLWQSTSPDDVTTVDNVGLLPPQASEFVSGGGSGSGGGGAGIQITSASQAGPQQKAIGNMLGKLLSALACDPECTSFLASEGINPVDLLTGIAKGGYFGHADISLNGDPNTVSAYVGGTEPAGQAITVNNQGAFFLGSVQGRGNLTVGPQNIAGDTSRAQAFILLHETGHLTGVLGPDLGVPKSGRNNDKAISQHCQKTINSFKE